MKTQIRHLIILISLFTCLLAMGLNGFGQTTTHIYITGSDTGNGNTNSPDPPSGTPAANIVANFHNAIERANAVGGNCIIHLRTNTLRETQRCRDILEGVNIQVINDTPQRKAVRWSPTAYTSLQGAQRMVGVQGTLTIGGEGCTSVLILRGQEGWDYYYPSETITDGITEVGARVLLKAEGNGVINIQDNCELCYGKVNVWVAGPNATVNQSGGVIYAAGDMNVNITQGTYNMSGGYITGYYSSSGNTTPDLTACPILDYDNFIPDHFTQGGTMDYWLDRNEIRDVLEANYPLNASDPDSKLNNATGVYIHNTKDVSGNHLAKFNMTGGSICGIYGDGNRPVIIGSSGNYDYQYATKPGGANYEEAGYAIENNGGECRISGGRIYLNHTTSSGGGIICRSWDFSSTDPNENFEHTHTYMSGGEISYCSGGSGGALRIETGSTVELSGGKITHCVSVPTAEEMDDPDNTSHGCNGAIRMVCSKLVMTDNAEISWCHSPVVGTGVCGGAIGAVFQKGWSKVYTTVHLHGGSIHHCKSRGYGGALGATDKGYEDAVGVDVQIKGCSIYDNEALIDGGGIYASGKTTVDITSSSNIYGNTADGNGGGVLLKSSDYFAPTLNITNSQIYSNTAVNGAGVYAEGGTFNLENGSNIHDNIATTNGGGFYLDGGTLNVSGMTEISGNNATGGNGGGVYQNGTMTVDGTQLRITGNTAGSATQTANNVYLPNTKAIEVGASVNAASVEMGITTENIATVGTDIPVLTAVSENEQKLFDIRDAMLYGTSRIADDRRVHKAKYPGAAALTLYFTKYDYDYDAFTTDFQNPIDSRIQLYKFMCWVNGVNGFSSTHPDAVGIVTADIEMNHITQWIPIGSATTPFTGKLLSKASYNSSVPESAPDAMHVISNLYIDASSGYANEGLFGVTQGATISGIIMEDCDFNISTGVSKIGSIIGLMKGGVLMNCGGSGTLTSTSNCTMGGLVGRVDKTEEGTPGLIHSCYSTMHLNGYEMGGIVAEIPAGCELKNSFANAKLQCNSVSSYCGGLAALCNGIMDNCYVREQAGGTHPNADHYGLAIGAGSGDNITNIYYPAGATPHGSDSHPTTTTWSSFGPTVTPYQYLVNDNLVAANDLGLLETLNSWVATNGSSTYASWMRTSASPINDDLPVLDFPAVCLVSKNNVDMIYSNDFNNRFERLLAGNLGTGEGTIYLYNNPTSAITLSNDNKSTELYIHEDVVLKHSSVIKAHVGITLDNSAGAGGVNPSFGGSDVIDWHFFSSALQAAPIGLSYPAATPAYNTEPGQATFTAANAANGYFPTNLDSYYTHWDLYGYCEPAYHWINYKRNSDNHWHEDWPDSPITYTNHTTFQPGYGYLVALKEEGYLQGYGTLNTNTGEDDDYISVPLSYTEGVSWTGRQGLNLLGNPYQSYLDLDKFAETNTAIWGGSLEHASYIMMDEENGGYVQYLYDASVNHFIGNRFLHPHQGFMVAVTSTDKSARFDNTMRNVEATGVTFRGEDRPNYPLVNLLATDANGNRDLVTVELGRPDRGGALKHQALRTSTGSLWCHYEDGDYAIVFTQPGLDVAHIRFATEEDADYTMTWNTQNGEFGYLHLIDNMTGADIDCLTTDTYRFTSKTTDYTSRFRLVFDYTGIDDHEVPEPVEGPATFAYYANGEIHLTDADDDASLQIIDMTGRVIVSRDAARHVSTEGLAAGVYVLRLTTTKGTRIQKIILN